MPLISVIIPVYNAGRTVLETIRSVQVQTFSDLEVIIINDGSTDDSLAKLQSIHDPRLAIFSYENGGLPVARNRGLDHAQGEYVSFIDADDIWLPEKLALQLQALEQSPTAGAAYSWTAAMQEQNSTISFAQASQPLFEGYVYPHLLLQNFIGSGSNILVRREAIAAVGNFDPTLKSCEDWDFYLRLAAQHPFVLVPKNLVLYRQGAGSMSSKGAVMEQAGLTVIERAYAQAPEAFQAQKPRTLGRYYFYCAEQFLANAQSRQDVHQARQRVLRAVRTDPGLLQERNTQMFLAKLLLREIFPDSVTAALQKMTRSYRYPPITDPRPNTAPQTKPLS